MTPDQRNNNLYSLSTKCCELQDNHACNRQCATCGFNAMLYTDGTVQNYRDVHLIQMNAGINYSKDRDYHNRQATNSFWGGIFFMGWMLLLMSPFLMCSVKGCIKDLKQSQPKPQAMAYQENSPVYPSEVRRYLDSVRDGGLMDMALRDVDNDGQVDCVDYAVTFYSISRLWNINAPAYSREAMNTVMVSNYNRVSGWSHLLNFIVYKGKWYAVEPQGISSGLYEPQKYWGNAYSPIYNQQETQYNKYLQHYEDEP